MEVLWTVIMVLITLITIYGWKKHTYWHKRNVKTPFFIPFIGNMYDLLAQTSLKTRHEKYLLIKNDRYSGFYEFIKPFLVVWDLDLLKAVLVKDADHFMDRRSFGDKDSDTFFHEFLSVKEGDEWKGLRSIVSSTFSSGKIRSTYPFIVEKAEIFISECKKNMVENSFVQIKELVRYFTLDVIASCAFGVDAKCIQLKEKSPLIRELDVATKQSASNFMRFIFSSIFPRISKFLKIDFSSHFSNQLSLVQKFVDQTIKQKLESESRRGDYLDVLLDAYKENKENKNSAKYDMTMSTVKAQAILFLFGGFDTVGSTLSIILYNLAKHTEVQEKLRRELLEIKERNGGKFNYQAIMEAPYLDACISESMRVNPAAPFTERQCSSDYRLPDTNVVIEKGIRVTIPIYNLHLDPDYWSEPFKYDPERFMPENKSNIVPYSYMPFGIGPRNCVAMRFAMLEMKVLISELFVDWELHLKEGFDIKFDKWSTFSILKLDENGLQVVMKKLEK